jgi:superfamily I DNA/RNA helicase
VPVASPETYLADLNEAQRDAVLQTEGPVLVIAGAGSGKTRVLTHRVAHLITAVGAKTNEILAITFTNKAADEMRTRLYDILGRDARGLWVLTFHAAAGRILRREIERLGYRSNFTIYDQADQVRLVKNVLEELERDTKRFVPRGIHAQISNAKNQLVTPDEYRSRVASFYDQTVAEVYDLYQRRLHASNAVDFDDILMLTVQILERFPDARKKWQAAFRYILVDEYQDTNHAQYRLLQLLAEKQRNVFAVGDPDQCLVAGTMITMADGSTKPIEDMSVGDRVLSCYGRTRFDTARVTRVHMSHKRRGVEIGTSGGRTIVSTPEHKHLASFETGSLPSQRQPTSSEPKGRERLAVSTLLVKDPERTTMFIPASEIRAGMSMLTGAWELDVIETVEPAVLDVPVYDLDVEPTHNFIANGLVTHNSIYAFRGADIRNIMEFEHDFPGTRVIALEQNYRSTNAILEGANSLIANNRERKPKNLFSDLGIGDPVRIVEVEDEHAEARFVAAEIARLVEEGFNGDEIAVFYRTNAQSRVLEDVLVRQGVAYQVIGGPRFYERAEVKDIVAYLQVLDNPYDSVSLLRMANKPRRGIGDTSLGRLQSYANGHGFSLWEALEFPEEAGVGAAPARAITSLRTLVLSLQEGVLDRPVADIVEDVLERSGYLEMLEAERTVEAQGRVENLQELVGVAREYQETAEEPSLSSFLQEISLYSDQDAIRGEGSLVTLMTLHNAKGLEFRAVFMIGIEEGIFPHARSIEEQGVEEERRLAYVGMTRAKERLTLLHASSRSLYGGRSHNLPSRFLDEVSGEHVERERLTPATWEARSRGVAPRTDVPTLSTGDSVRHNTLGEGVVVRIEAGGVVTVRFANDGAERRLMLDYAPLEKIA